MTDPPPPPEMATWNLVLRFVLEVVALASLAAGAWAITSGRTQWFAGIGSPVGAALAWGALNVRNDPSRSGAAPIEVPGWYRLVLEVIILGGGAGALAVALHPAPAIAFALLIVGHYGASWSRVRWLIDR